MKKSFTIINLLTLLLFAASGFTGAEAVAQTKKPEPAVSVKLVQPHRGDITRNVVLPGNVTANQQVALYAKVGGYLKSISVDKGDEVKQGDVIAEVEVPELIADQTKYKAEMLV